MKNKFKKIVGSGILTFGMALSTLAQTSGTALSADHTTVYLRSGSNLEAIDASTGASKWSYATPAAINTDPGVGEDGTIYVGASDDKIYAINNDGTLKWSSQAALLSAPVTWAQFDGGDLHSAAVKSNGTVWTWGDNQFGELGDGSTIDHHSPEQALNVSNMVGVACGHGFTLGLKSDGTVWAWGLNANGELGNGTTTSTSSPQQVPGLSNIVSVVAGGQCSFALGSNGNVFAWGDNSAGQMGDNTTTDRHSPGQVSGMTNVIMLSAGQNSVMALRSDGLVFAWGSNQNGEAGVGSNGNIKKLPVQVNTISNVLVIASGANYSFALDTNGVIWVWGGNGSGQLGDGTTTTRTSPEVNVHLSFQHVVSMSAGEGHSLFVFANGTAEASGANGQGQLGDGTTTDRHTPVAVSGITQGVTIRAGSKHSLIANSDLSLETWGDNSNGQLGDGTQADRHTPVTVPSFSF
jgi:alpha-tubulin suppressor-like RCC1 family protein